MGIFYNHATLSYNDNSTESNVVTGTLVSALNLTKTALKKEYQPGDKIAFLVNIVNRSMTDYNEIKLVDDLGAFSRKNGEKLIPLTFVNGSVRYIYNNESVGTRRTDIVDGKLEIYDVDVPKNGNSMIIFEAMVNEYAPLFPGAEINTEIIGTGAQLPEPISDTEKIKAAKAPYLMIGKMLTPQMVFEHQKVTYTFVISNYGSAAADYDDNAVITDTFMPKLNITDVHLEDTVWTQGVDYFYTAEGEFRSADHKINVEAATYSMDKNTGIWTVTPGVTKLYITGTM